MTLPYSLRSSAHACFYISAISNAIMGLSIECRAMLIGAIARNYCSCASLFTNFRCQNWFKLASEQMDCSLIHFALLLGRLWKFPPEACFNTFPGPYSDQAKVEIPIPDIFKNIYPGGEPYVQSGRYYLHSFNGQILQAALRYSSNNYNFFVLATRNSRMGDRLSIGASLPQNRLHNFTFIENNPTAHVIWPLNPSVLASLLDSYPIELSLKKCNTIFTGVFGGGNSLESTAVSELLNHKVTLLCSPDCEEYGKINKIVKLCNNNGANEIKIFPYPIEGERCSSHLDRLLYQIASKLRNEKIDIRDYEKIASLCRHIGENSISIEQLEKWEVYHSLRKPCESKTNDSELLFPFHPWNIGPESDHQEQLSTSKLFNCENITLIHGVTGTAKSWLGLEIGIALAYGRSVIGLKASKPRKTVYMDGEMRNSLPKRVKQLLGKGAEGISFHDNLQILEPDEGHGFLDKIDVFIEQLTAHNVEVLIVDNILALCPHISRGASDVLFDFARRLSKAGIALLIINHDGKTTDDYLGGAQLGALIQNIIRITDARSEDLTDYESNVDIIKAKSDTGPFVRIRLEKTKVAPYWEKESILMHMFVDGQWKQLTNWPKISCEKHKTEDCIELDARLEEMIMSLPPDERKTMEFIYPRKGGIKRQELDKHCGWEEQKSMDVLNSLILKGFLIPEGKGKGRVYKPNV